MRQTVGLLLARSVLQRAVVGKATHEIVGHYARAAREYDVELLLFSPSGIDRRKGRVRGYVPKGENRFQRTVRPLPRVVYDRTSPKRTATGKWLQSRGAAVFNPPLRLDKYAVYEVLRRGWRTQRRLPETYLLTEATFAWFSDVLAGGAEVFLKPCGGSQGRGIGRVIPQGSGRCVYQQGKRIVPLRSYRRAWIRLRGDSKKRRGKCLLQRGVQLAEDAGRRFDLRIQVQRDRLGEWKISAVVGRRAGGVGYLTNFARGATLETDVRSMIRRSLPGFDCDEVYQRTMTAALDVADGMARAFPLIADLGLDMGIDRSGRPWLIEVNLRPLRPPTGGAADFYDAYRTPIGYAVYLNEHRWQRDLGSIFFKRV